jgi:hypothetical protein
MNVALCTFVHSATFVPCPGHWHSNGRCDEKKEAPRAALHGTSRPRSPKALRPGPGTQDADP